MPFLSIIVPVFNKFSYLDSCIESILGQTYNDFELILVDDGSTDGSGLRCDFYKSSDPRIKVIHQENNGVSAARNTGINMSAGEFIGFVDGDDIIEPDMYETLVRNAIDTDSDISICGIKKIHQGRNKAILKGNRIVVFDKDQGFSAVLNGLVDMSANNKIFKSAIVKNKNIRFEGRFKEDFLFNIFVFFAAEKSVFQDTPKYVYILRESSVSVEKFSQKDMEGLSVDSRILDVVSNEMESHVEEAQVNFFIQNLYTLNLILLSSGKNHSRDYEIVNDNLKKHSFLVSRLGLLGTKYRLAYSLFRISPLLYRAFLQAYVLIVPSEVGVRQK